MSEQYDSVETEETETSGNPEVDAAIEATPEGEPETAEETTPEETALEASEGEIASESDDEAAQEDTAAQEDEEPEEPEEDGPLEEFRRELWAKPGDWFVVHTYSGMENRVKSNLENRIISLNMEDYIHEIVVPTEEVASKSSLGTQQKIYSIIATDGGFREKSI